MTVTEALLAAFTNQPVFIPRALNRGMFTIRYGKKTVIESVGRYYVFLQHQDRAHESGHICIESLRLVDQ